MFNNESTKSLDQQRQQQRLYLRMHVHTFLFVHALDWMIDKITISGEEI